MITDLVELRAGRWKRRVVVAEPKHRRIKAPHRRAGKGKADPMKTTDALSGIELSKELIKSISIIEDSSTIIISKFSSDLASIAPR